MVGDAASGGMGAGETLHHWGTREAGGDPTAGSPPARLQMLPLVSAVVDNHPLEGQNVGPQLAEVVLLLVLAGTLLLQGGVLLVPLGDDGHCCQQIDEEFLALLVGEEHSPEALDLVRVHG